MELTLLGGIVWVAPEGQTVGGVGLRGRRLKTATAVLRVLRCLAARPDGVTVAEIAGLLGKSLYTAYYLLNTLCAEGFARRDPHDGRYYPVTVLIPSRPVAEPATRARLAASTRCTLESSLQALNQKTRSRTYLVVAHGLSLTVEAVIGHQGQLGVKGIDRYIRAEAHALAVGKAVLAHAPAHLLEQYRRRYGLPAFTERTIRQWPDLVQELDAVRREGVAVDVEEFQEGLCCLAAPVEIPSAEGPVLGAVGIAVPVRRFFASADDLKAVLRSHTRSLVRRLSSMAPRPRLRET